MNPILMHPRRFDLLVWAVCCLLAAVTLLVYTGAGTAGGRGTLILPLDDVYIHFQYARQMAAGEPYVYNPGGVATSGATSFLYPYLLALGVGLGFHDLALGYWALGIGAVALIASLWMIYLLVRDFPAPRILALAVTVIAGSTGSLAWHFMSGMETGLAICFLLMTLYGFVQQRYRLFLFAAILLALIRPEASMLAVLAAGGWFLRELANTSKHSLRHWRTSLNHTMQARLLWLVLPLLAAAVQPLVNLMLTGSAQASGSAAKSILNTIPHDWGVILPRILSNFMRLWSELLTGYSPREGWYSFPLLSVLAVVGWLALLRRRDGRWTALLLLGWLLALSGAVSTLDTAFWHFKRYQMPALVLFFPLAGWGAAWLWSAFAVHPQRQRVLRVMVLGVMGFGVLFSPLIGVQFVGYFHTNVGYVYAQPYQMALWLRANTPEDAVVAVHDVGMMRYIGGRTTLDMVGLTTPGAAEYWRNGPGSVAEFLIDQQPDYIASYGEGHGYGLGMLAQTSLYANELARFEVVLDDRVNVALAASVQGIYAPAWEEFWDDRDLVGYDHLSSALSQEHVVATIYVGDVASEREYNYQVVNDDTQGRFPTEPFEFRYFFNDALVGLNVTIPLLDSVRGVQGYEQFNFTLPSTDRDVVLATRVHSAASGTLAVYLNGELLDRNVVPARPGRWLDINTAIPRDRLRLRNTMRIVPEGSEIFYFPATHIFFTGELYTPTTSESSASFQDGAVRLGRPRLQFYGTDPTSRFDGLLWVHLDWRLDTRAYGDYRLFIHLYDDINQPPLSGVDVYLGNGKVPLGNALPSLFVETYTLDLREFQPGRYRLAIGFYNPYTQERLMPTSDVYEVSADGRLWLGEVEIP